MAERTIQRLIDDLDGSVIPDGGERIEFSVRGAAYHIDLSKANVDKFDKALKPYISAATKLRDPRRQATTGTRIGPPPSKEQLEAIRNWARKNGHEVANRGRIKADVRAAYEAAH
jgi:hypothetical protein